MIPLHPQIKMHHVSHRQSWGMVTGSDPSTKIIDGYLLPGGYCGIEEEELPMGSSEVIACATKNYHVCDCLDMLASISNSSHSSLLLSEEDGKPAMETTSSDLLWFSWTVAVGRCGLYSIAQEDVTLHACPDPHHPGQLLERRQS